MKQLRDMTEPELKGYFGSLARLVNANLPDGTLFALLVFDDPRLAQCVSNGTRSDVIKAMRECADRLEKKEDVPR